MPPWEIFCCEGGCTATRGKGLSESPPCWPPTPPPQGQDPPAPLTRLQEPLCSSLGTGQPTPPPARHQDPLPPTPPGTRTPYSHPKHKRTSFVCCSQWGSGVGCYNQKGQSSKSSPHTTSGGGPRDRDKGACVWAAVVNSWENLPVGLRAGLGSFPLIGLGRGGRLGGGRRWRESPVGGRS